MRSDRVDRLNRLFQQQLSQIILRELDFPAGVIVSITSVDTAPDLSQSKVYVSIFSDLPGERAAVFEQLKRAAKHLRYELADAVEIRKMPRLYLELDDSLEASDRVQRLLGSDD